MPFPTAADDGREGEGDLGISEDELASVISIVLHSARRTRKRLGTIQGRVDENKISVRMHQEIQSAQRRRRLKQFEFFLEGIVNPPRRGPTKIAGRIDFLVKFRRHIGEYEAYFGVESKRVRPRRAKLQGYYVEAGVGKFVHGPYSVGHPAALLVGYVLQPPASGVLADLERRIAAAHPAAAPLVPWTGVGPYRDALVVEGTMPRTAEGPIRLLHALVRMH